MQRTTGQGATAAQGRARLHAPPQATTVKRTHNSEANSNDAQQWSSQLWRTYILHARSLLRRLSHFCIIMTQKICREPMQWVILMMSHLKSCKFLWTWYFDQMGRSSSRYCINDHSCALVKPGSSLRERSVNYEEIWVNYTNYQNLASDELFKNETHFSFMAELGLRLMVQKYNGLLENRFWHRTGPADFGTFT